MRKLLLPLCVAGALVTGCGGKGADATADTGAAEKPLTVADAQAFVAEAEATMSENYLYYARTAWVYATYITDDTEALSVKADTEATLMAVKYATESAKYIDIPGLDYDTQRKLNMLRSGLVIPAPNDVEKTKELAAIGAKMAGMYGKGKYCDESGECKSIVELEQVMDFSKDEKALREAWTGWRTISPPMKALYARQVELGNEGAKALGFDDIGAMWRSKYDMPAEQFPQELDKAWGQVKPFYDSLHCYVRGKLGEHYGTEIVPQDQAIPAHILGNMWAQDWKYIYDLVKPPKELDGDIDITALLQKNNYTVEKMFKTGEGFFSSLGFDPLPETFWERSMLVKPKDREVVCHASAWDLDEKDDLRVKMCTEINADDFRTVHHELGHNYYQRAYKNQPALYRGSANDGFHEAIGDTIAPLSLTPEYLKQIGLIDEVPDASGDIGFLLRKALDRIAFVPFALVVDQWRWKVFAGEVGPEGYNDLWWQLREQYQGVRPPVERPADAFDPGAKYHVPGNTPYTRYFLSYIQQFQFHKALCKEAGFEGPLHRCTIYGSKEAGAKLKKVLEMGQSRPWQEAMEVMTGSPELDASALVEYFEPLKGWMDEQNKQYSCGW